MGAHKVFTPQRGDQIDLLAMGRKLRASRSSRMAAAVLAKLFEYRAALEIKHDSIRVRHGCLCVVCGGFLWFLCGLFGCGLIVRPHPKKTIDYQLTGRR